MTFTYNLFHVTFFMQQKHNFTQIYYNGSLSLSLSLLDTHTCTQTHKHKPAHKHTHTYTHTYTYTRAHKHTHTHTHARAHMARRSDATDQRGTATLRAMHQPKCRKGIALQLQCIVSCCSAATTVYCLVLQCCNYSVLSCVAVRCSVLQFIAVKHTFVRCINPNAEKV